MSKLLITSKVAVFSYNGKTYTVMKSNPNFEAVVDKLKMGDFKQAYQLVQTKTTGKIKIKGNDLYFKEDKFDPIFAEAYAVAKEHGLSVDKLELFFENLSKNPSPISVHAFSSFLAKSRMPITDRGTFLAYKKVTSSFKDIYTCQFDNRPGSVCSMPRSSVNSNQNATCSSGFHICSYEYLPNFGSYSNGDQVIVVEVHPKDVVAVPPDYKNTKMRVASYRVLSTLKYFMDKLKTYEADALGNIPIFNTSFFKDNWDEMFDIEDDSTRMSSMSPKLWLESRKEAV